MEQSTQTLTTVLLIQFRNRAFAISLTVEHGALREHLNDSSHIPTRTHKSRAHTSTTGKLSILIRPVYEVQSPYISMVRGTP